MRVTKEPETRKKEILEAAKNLFLQKGYAKTSITDIAGEVNVAKGLFYYYFPRKECLFDAIGDEFVETLKEQWAQRRLQPSSLLEDLSAYLYFYLDQVEDNRGLLQLSASDNSPFGAIMKSRLIDTAIEQVYEIFSQHREEFSPPMTYPEYAIRILIVGFADLYMSGITDRGVYHTLLLESMGVNLIGRPDSG
jgi:AcrR family transcriptional regulator